jgi:hypothetical protein
MDERPDHGEPEPQPEPQPVKKRWEEPKLTFLEPKLTKQGELKDVTGFLGTFSP